MSKFNVEYIFNDKYFANIVVICDDVELSETDDHAFYADGVCIVLEDPISRITKLTEDADGN